jgi:hypothetical protein
MKVLARRNLLTSFVVDMEFDADGSRQNMCSIALDPAIEEKLE